MRNVLVPLPLAAVTAAVLLTGGCGSSKPPVCSDASALKTSVENLKSVPISKSGLTTLGNDVSTIQKQLNTLQSSAKSQFGPQISALRESLATLRPAVAAATAGPSVSTLAAVATGTAKVVQSANSLQSAVKNTC
jgi:hypothetical protein